MDYNWGSKELVRYTIRSFLGFFRNLIPSICAAVAILAPLLLA